MTSQIMRHSEAEQCLRRNARVLEAIAGAVDLAAWPSGETKMLASLQSWIEAERDSHQGEDFIVAAIALLAV